MGRGCGVPGRIRPARVGARAIRYGRAAEAVGRNAGGRDGDGRNARKIPGRVTRASDRSGHGSCKAGGGRFAGISGQGMARRAARHPCFGGPAYRAASCTWFRRENRKHGRTGRASTDRDRKKTGKVLVPNQGSVRVNPDAAVDLTRSPPMLIRRSAPPAGKAVDRVRWPCAATAA